MKAVSVNEFYSNFQKYLTIILRGENIVLSRNNKRIAVIEPVRSHKDRPHGLCKGEFTVPDDFNAPLSDDLTDLFYK